MPIIRRIIPVTVTRTWEVCLEFDPEQDDPQQIACLAVELNNSTWADAVIDLGPINLKAGQPYTLSDLVSPDCLTPAEILAYQSRLNR